MAQKRKTTKKLDKKKKKKWLSILAPKSFGNVEIGESTVATSTQLIGKRIKLNPSYLTKTKGSNTRLTFEVKEVKEEKGLTEFIGYEILPSHINRIVRKNKTKIDTSQKLETKDNQKVILKTVIITRSKVQGSASRALKTESLKSIEEQTKKYTLEKLLDAAFNYSLQKTLKDSLKRITPIQTVEVKYLFKK